MVMENNYESVNKATIKRETHTGGSKGSARDCARLMNYGTSYNLRCDITKGKDSKSKVHLNLTYRL